MLKLLFKSYGYLEYFISKTSIKNPFRLKQLLRVFIDIKIDKTDIFYMSLFFSMKSLKEKANQYYLKNPRNAFIAKNLYEECLIIGKPFEKDNVAFLLNIEIYRDYNDIRKRM